MSNKEMSFKVTCRFRPQKKIEVEQGFKPCVNLGYDNNSVKIKVRIEN